MKKIKKKEKYQWTVFFLAVFLVVVFSIFQSMKFSQGATATDQVNLSVTVAQTISLNCGADVSLGTLTPGTPVTGTTVCTVTTNAQSGYDLKVKRDDADTTMDHTSDSNANITDKTAWDPTASSGAGNAATWTGTGLGFTVFASTATKNTTWWGTGTTVTDTANKYAGFPYLDSSTYYLIMDHDTYSSSSTTTSIGYKLDVPTTQKSGSYDGSVTYQVVTKP